MEPVLSPNTDFLLKKIVDIGARECQRIGGLVNQIKKINHALKLENIWLPYSNIGAQFEILVLGFDGDLHPAKVVFDSSCDADSVISSSIAIRAGMSIEKFGVSYVYVVRIGKHEFFGYSIAHANNYGISHVEDMCGSSCVAKIDDHEIDIIIGYRTMQEMAHTGINFCIDTKRIPCPNYIPIPYRGEQGLSCNIADIAVYMQIASGNFFDEDITLSMSFVKKNSNVLANITGSEICTHGIIPNMMIRYKNLEIKLIDVKFVAYSDSDDDDDVIDCIGGINLIKRLWSQNIIVKIIV